MLEGVVLRFQLTPQSSACKHANSAESIWQMPQWRRKSLFLWLLSPFVTQQGIFDGSEEKESSLVANWIPTTRLQIITCLGSRTKESSLDDTKGGYIQRLNSWYEIKETWQLHGSCSPIGYLGLGIRHWQRTTHLHWTHSNLTNINQFPHVITSFAGLIELFINPWPIS